MLVITDHNKLLQLGMDKFKDIKEMGPFPAEWMKKSFQMTASMPEVTKEEVDVHVQMMDKTDTDNSKMSQQNHRNENCEKDALSDDKYNHHPSCFLFNSKVVQTCKKQDEASLLKHLQMHQCSKYCMRKRKYI